MNITQVGNSAVIAVVALDGSLHFHSQAIGTTAWNHEQVAGPGTTSTDSLNLASVAQAGNSAVIAAVDAENGVWSYWQTIGTAPWNAQRVAAPGTTQFISLAQVGNSAVIAAVGTDNSLWVYWETIGTGLWNAEMVAAPGTTQFAALAQVGNSAVIAVVGTDKSLWSYSQTIGTAPWKAEQVAAPGAAQFVSVAQVVENAVIAAVGTDYSVWLYWQPVGTTQWNPQQVFNPGVSQFVSVTQGWYTAVVIATVNLNGSVTCAWQTVGAAPPINGELVAEPGSTRLASVAQIENFPVVAAVSSQDLSLWLYSQAWNSQQVAPAGSG